MSVPYSSSYVAGMLQWACYNIIFFLPSSHVYNEVDWCVRFDSLLEGGGTSMSVFFFQVSSGFVCDDLPL